jgi:predicted nucleic acid-binding protein
VIVADTGAILALIDADDRHHDALLDLYEENPDAWVLPWAVLPEVDYLLLTHVSAKAELAFMRDVADARYLVDWGGDADLRRARELCDRYRGLRLGLVDGVVMATAERLKADTIATLDVRHFGAVEIRGAPRLFPRDRSAG